MNQNEKAQALLAEMQAQPPAEAQAQGGGEVVAEVCEDQSGSKYLCWSPGLTPLPPAGTRLYTAPPSAPVGVENIIEAFDEITGLCRHLRQGGPAPEDLHDLSDALDEAIGIAGDMLAALAQQPAACPKCGGTGEADSGGIMPWGAPAMIPCDCQQPAAPSEAVNVIAALTAALEGGK